MSISRRGLIRRASLAAAALGVRQAFGEGKWPDQTLHVIVPRAPGGGTDILIRNLSTGMQDRLGQPFLVENKPDTAAVIGATYVARARPDGYVFLACDNAFYQNPAILKSLPFDTLKDFSGVTMLANAPVILVVNAEGPYKSVSDLVGVAKDKPGTLTFASGGIGSSTHFGGIQFGLAAGINLIHVPYRSSGAALNDLLGQQVTMQFGGISSAKGQIDAGKLRALATTGASRDPTLPDVPTFSELGLKDVDITSLWGVHAPAGTPIEIRSRLRDMLVEVMKLPDVSKRMSDLGYIRIGSTPDELEAETKRLVAQWIDLSHRVKLSGD
jgi:tripartite-type tricarboxylate transporter receptor subunit TctC